jgi:hypothetical protein
MVDDPPAGWRLFDPPHQVDQYSLSRAASADNTKDFSLL